VLPIRVAVYSPQPVVHEGIRSLLANHPDRVRIVPSPGQPEDPDPDVVLYDVIALLDDDTKQLVKLIEMTTSKVLAVGRDLRPDLIGQALATGVDGFFSLGVDEEELLAAVESAASGSHKGHGGEHPTVGSRGFAARAHLGTDVGLTERQAEVLTLIAQGLTNQQIASALFLSINSIKTHIRAAYRKIGVDNRAGAVGWAIRHDVTPEREMQGRAGSTPGSRGMRGDARPA
jgi:DNA-binding NarL/FixJ family response regulator